MISSASCKSACQYNEEKILNFCRHALPRTHASSSTRFLERARFDRSMDRFDSISDQEKKRIGERERDLRNNARTQCVTTNKNFTCATLCCSFYSTTTYGTTTTVLQLQTSKSPERDFSLQLLYPVSISAILLLLHAQLLLQRI